MAAGETRVPQIIDIHTHCSPRQRDDPFGVAAIMRGSPIGRNTLLNYRGLPAIGHWEMTDFDFQQEACAKAGLTGRLDRKSTRLNSSH